MVAWGALLVLELKNKNLCAGCWENGSLVSLAGLEPEELLPEGQEAELEDDEAEARDLAMEAARTARAAGLRAVNMADEHWRATGPMQVHCILTTLCYPFLYHPSLSMLTRPMKTSASPITCRCLLRALAARGSGHTVASTLKSLSNHVSG